MNAVREFSPLNPTMCLNEDLVHLNHRRCAWKPKSLPGFSSFPLKHWTFVNHVEDRWMDAWIQPPWRFPGRRMLFMTVPSVGRVIACPTRRNIRRLLGSSRFGVFNWIINGPKLAYEDWTPASIFIPSVCLSCPNFGHGPCQVFNQGLVVQHCK